jgi:hypothetical protein
LITGSAIVDDGEQQRQDERVAPLPADEAAIFAFRPDAGKLPLPRWLIVALMWMAALAVAAAAAGAGLLVMRERQTDKSLEMVAAHARASAPPLPVTAADLKLDRAGLVKDTVVSSAERTGSAESAVKRQPTASPTKAARAKTLSAKQKSKVSSAKAVPSKSRPGKAKTARKPGSVKKTAVAAQARKSQSYTWPRPNVSVAERLNAARKACRARPHAPGECNLRACDVLGSAHPACR